MTIKKLLTAFVIFVIYVPLHAQNVGIGTTTPARTFVVRNDSNAVNTVVTELASGNGGAANYHLVTTKGAASNTAGVVVTKMGLLHGDANANHNSYIRFHRGAGNTGGFLSMSTDTDIERLRIHTNGNVSIGSSTAAAGEKLAISNGETQLGFYPGFRDNVANPNWTTLDMPGNRSLRIWDDLSVSGNSYVDDTLITNRIRIGNPLLNGVLRSDAAGNGVWAPFPTEADPKIGSLTLNRVPKWGGSTLTDGSITDVGTGIGILNPSPMGELHVRSTVLDGPEVLDQQQTSENALIQAVALWQSFTAGATGALSRVDLKLRSPLGNVSSPGTLTIREGVGVTGKIIELRQVMIVPLTNQFQSFTTPSIPLVEAGKVYTIELRVNSATTGWIFYSTENPYPDGVSAMGAGTDYLFKTYVAPSRLANALQVRQGNTGIAGPASVAAHQKITIHGDNGGSFSISPGMADNVPAPDWTTLDIPNNGTLRIWDNLSVDGNVGINANPLEKLEIGGKVRAEGYVTRTGVNGSFGGNYFNFNWTGSQLNAWVDGVLVGGGVTSDRRLKDEIYPLADNALAKMMQLQPVSFHYKNIPNSIFTGNPVIQEGFIADELQTIIPSAVTGEKDAMSDNGQISPQTVNALPTVSVLTKAMQEQQQLIEAQQKQINELMERLGKLEKLMQEKKDVK